MHFHRSVCNDLRVMSRHVGIFRLYRDLKTLSGIRAFSFRKPNAKAKRQKKAAIPRVDVKKPPPSPQPNGKFLQRKPPQPNTPVLRKLRRLLEYSRHRRDIVFPPKYWCLESRKDILTNVHQDYERAAENYLYIVELFTLFNGRYNKRWKRVVPAYGWLHGMFMDEAVDRAVLKPESDDGEQDKHYQAEVAKVDRQVLLMNEW